MIIAKATLNSKDFGKEELKICTKENEENNSTYHINRPLANEILKAGAQNKNRIKCNGVSYTIQEYTRYKKENLCVDFTRYDEPQIIYINKRNCVCTACQNKYGYSSIENRNARLYTMQKKIVVIDVQFCRHCHSYYVDEQSLIEYEKEYGVLLFKHVKREIDGWNKISYHHFKPDTVLGRYGYSTSLDPELRRRILSELIDKEISDKPEIKQILSTFISTRSKRFKNASLVWKEDLLYVNQYNSKKQDTYENFILKKK